MRRVWRSFFALVRLPGRPTMVRILSVALLVAVIAWYFGADAWHSVLLGVGLTTLGLIFFLDTAGSELSDADWRGHGIGNREGARSDVTELSWSLRGSYGRVDNRAVWRIRGVARQRLLQYQLDLFNPADRRNIEQLIGRRAYVVLVRDARRPPWLRSFIHCLDALDALETTPKESQ
jgi:hypothetical protein